MDSTEPQTQNPLPPPKISHGPQIHTNFPTHHHHLYLCRCCCHHHHHHHHAPAVIHLHLHLHGHHHHHHHHHQPLPLPPAINLPPQVVSSGQDQATATPSTGLEQQEGLEENLELEEEEEGDDVFVMTDEWKEFFAKSEAKRRLKKQQSKKGGK